MTATLLLLLLQVRAPADTQLHWRGELGIGLELHSEERATWTTGRAAFGYRRGRGGINADLTRIERFERVDRAIGLEAYLPAGPRALLSLRGAVAPEAEVIAERDLSIELTHFFSPRWQGSGRYRQTEYPAETVHSFTAGIGHARGLWYLRVLGTIVPREEAFGYGAAIRARRYLDPRRPALSIDLFADVGRELVILGPLIPPALRTTTSIGARWQRPVGTRTGMSFTIYRNTEADAPSRIGLGAGAYRVW